jgi:hypothetical protein
VALPARAPRIWDMTSPCAPISPTSRVDGTAYQGIAQPTSRAGCMCLDRTKRQNRLGHR